MADAEHRDLRDVINLVKRLFNLAAGDVLATGLDHVLLAVHHGQIAILGDDSQITGVKPAKVIAAPLEVNPPETSIAVTSGTTLPGLVGPQLIQ
jgi:hypothetical protein